MTTMGSPIASLTVFYSIVYSGTDQRKHQSSASLALVWGIHRGPVNSPHKWPVTRKMFPFDDVIMTQLCRGLYYYCDLTLSQRFQPIVGQLSMKAVLPFAKLTTRPYRSINTGPWCRQVWVYEPHYMAFFTHTGWQRCGSDPMLNNHGKRNVTNFRVLQRRLEDYRSKWHHKLCCFVTSHYRNPHTSQATMAVFKDSPCILELVWACMK